MTFDAAFGVAPRLGGLRGADLSVSVEVHVLNEQGEILEQKTMTMAEVQAVARGKRLRLENGFTYAAMRVGRWFIPERMIDHFEFTVINDPH